MENFKHECNGKITESSLEAEFKCDKCECSNDDVTEVPCACECHDN